MKRKLYILALILLNLITFTSTSYAQILEKNDTKKLLIYPYNFKVEGHFDIKSNNPLKKYFVDVNGILRIDEKTIALKTKDQFYAQIRVEVYKGSLFLGGLSEYKGPGYHGKHRVNVREGRLPSPIDINGWGVNRLSMEDRDITISIYDQNTNELLEKKRYKLYPDTVYQYQAKMLYTNLSGEEKEYNGIGRLRPDINYNLPIRIVVDDGWDRTYKVTSFLITGTDAMYNTIPQPHPGDTLTSYEKSHLKIYPRDKTTYVTKITAVINNVEYMMFPIKIRK